MTPVFFFFFFNIYITEHLYRCIKINKYYAINTIQYYVTKYLPLNLSWTLFEISFGVTDSNVEPLENLCDLN